MNLPGSMELLIIFGVALLLFGPSKLPKLGSALGETIKNFKKGMAKQDEELNLADNEEQKRIVKS